MQRYCASALALITVGGAFADPSPPETPPVSTSPVISTDRPSFSDGVGIVPTGHFQLETGWTLTFRDDDAGETIRDNAPEVLARVAVIENRLELRFLTSGYNWVNTDGGSDPDGWSDLAIGAKFRLSDQDGLLPNIAFSATTTIPSGSEEFSSRHWDPILKFLWSYDLGSGFGLDGNLNWNYPSARGGDHWSQFQGSLYLTFAATSDLSFFLEYFAITEFTDDGGTAQSIDLGLGYLLNSTTSLDLRIGVGLNDTADDFFVGAGISFLF